MNLKTSIYYDCKEQQSISIVDVDDIVYAQILLLLLSYFDDVHGTWNADCIQKKLNIETMMTTTTTVYSTKTILHICNNSLQILEHVFIHIELILS